MKQVCTLSAILKNFTIVSHFLSGSNCTTSVLTSNIPLCSLLPMISWLLDARRCNDWIWLRAAVRTVGDTIANAVVLSVLYQMLLLSFICSLTSLPRYSAKRTTRDHSSGTSFSKKTLGLTINELKKKESQLKTPLHSDTFVHCISIWDVSKNICTIAEVPSCFTTSTQYTIERVVIIICV